MFVQMIGLIDKKKKKAMNIILNSFSSDDELICYLASSGGESNIASYLKEKISVLPKSTVYGGTVVSSGGAIIYSSFKKRYAFKDSKFLIHPCKPPPGMERTELFDQFDQEVWEFMSQRMKISAKDIEIIANKDKKISAQEALKIGLVHEILPGSCLKNYKKLFKKWPQL